MGSKEVATGFLAALRREYVENVDAAVGEFFEATQIDNDLEDLLETSFEQRVRDADDALSEIMKIVAEWLPTLHEGIWCDECNDSPISGNRFWKQLQDDTYDLCESCYENLDDDKKGELALKQPQSGQEDLVPKEEPVQEPVQERSAEEAVFNTTDLTASCMADIEETFKQLSEQEYQEAEAEAARLIAQAEAKAAEEAAAAKAAEEAAAAKAAEEAAEEQTAIPLEWQGVVTALVNMGFSSSLAEEVTMSSEGNFDQALECALSYVPPPPPPPPAAALIKPAPSQDAWEDEWDCLVDELVEMGFEDVATNKIKVAEHKGDLKSTVTALISEERAKRSPQL